MFVVNGLKSGTCSFCEKDTECFEVVCQKGTLSGLLCPKDFQRQVKARTVKEAPRVAQVVPNGPAAVKVMGT